MNNQHHKKLQHHFLNLDQQFQSSQLGMWAFLATEILFFGALFLAYIVYRMQYPEGWALASQKLDVMLGAVNTVFLIGSSLTMALAVRHAHLGEKKNVIVFLGLTIFLGAVFLGIKGVEYSHKFHEHLVPGANFFFPDYPGAGPELFFSLYFAMTGLHAVHMIGGIVGIFILMWMTYRGEFCKEYSTPIEMMGLYWHFVDIVWIFLFPILYLVLRHH